VRPFHDATEETAEVLAIVTNAEATRWLAGHRPVRPVALAEVKNDLPRFLRSAQSEGIATRGMAAVVVTTYKQDDPSGGECPYETGQNG